jgi:hypothetical protein
MGIREEKPACGRRLETCWRRQRGHPGRCGQAAWKPALPVSDVLQVQKVFPVRRLLMRILANEDFPGEVVEAGGLEPARIAPPGTWDSISAGDISNQSPPAAARNSARRSYHAV